MRSFWPTPFTIKNKTKPNASLLARKLSHLKERGTIMPVPVFNIDKKPLSTSQLIQRAAYISRETLHDELYDRNRHPHKAKSDQIYQDVILPEGAPQKYKDIQNWNDKKNIQMLWNDVNKTGYTRVARSYYAALPYEATREQQIKIINNFAWEAFVSKGYIVQYDIHDEKPTKKKTRKQREKLEKEVMLNLGQTDTGNKNIHVHFLVADMPCKNGELIKARTENGKSKTIYIDNDGKTINMIEMPKLKKGRLQYDKNGNIIMTMGYKKMLTDQNGEPILDKDGKPVLEDIRVVTGESKNGKYKKTTYYRLTKKTNPMDETKIFNEKENKWEDITYKRIRKTWEKCHNDVVKNYNIKSKNGNLAVINMDSYAEQDKILPEDLQRIPQKKEWDNNRNRNAQAIEDNKKITEHNKQVMEIRKAKEEQSELDKAVLEIQQNALEEKRLVEMLHPEKVWTDIWVSQAEKLQKEIIRIFGQASNILQQTMDAGANKYYTLQESPENNIERKRIAQHYNLIKFLKEKLPASITDINEIRKSANQAWEKLPDQLKVAFVKEQYGLEQSIIYAQVLAREKRDLNIIDGLEKECPFIPNNKSTQVAIRKATKSICGTVNIKSYEAAAYEKWDTGTYQAPPIEIINLVNTYASLDKYYVAKLTSTKWTKQNVIAGINYNPETIEQTARAEMTALREEQAKQAELEKQAIKKAAAERAAAEKAQREAELIRRTTERKAEDRRIFVQSNWQKLVPQFQLAIKNNDRDSVMKISALVKDAFGEKGVQTKYNRACQDRDQEHEKMLHRYAELHRHEELNRMEKLLVNQGRYITDKEAELSLESQFVTKNNKINARKLNAAVQEHNKNVRYDIETKKYQEYSDEANFWYGMLHPEKAIRGPKENTATPALEQGKNTEKEMPVEIQIGPDNKQNRASATKQTTVSATVSQNDKNGTNLLPSGIGKNVNIRGGWKEKDEDHEKSEMEITEEEMKKNWDPNRKGPSL